MTSAAAQTETLDSSSSAVELTGAGREHVTWWNVLLLRAPFTSFGASPERDPKVLHEVFAPQHSRVCTGRS